MKKHLLILIALVAINSTAFAQTFEREGIYYRIASHTEPYIVTVIANTDNPYSGAIVIPASVIYEGLTYTVWEIGQSAFSGCSDLTDVTIPNSVTTIAFTAFNSCRNLTSLIIGNSVRGIDAAAFVNCSGLTNVTIPNSVTVIGGNAFKDCSNLTNIIIGNSITDIGPFAFKDCSDLTSVIIKATIPPTLVDRVFENVPKDIPVYVPCQSLEAYQTATWWSEFTNIQCDPTGITEINTFPYEVYTRHNTLIIKQAEGQPIAIFDMMGRTIFQTTATEETTCTLPTAGVYIVRVGVKGFVRKIVIN